jgi:hypothetical protein
MAFAPPFQRPFSATFDRRAAAGNGLLTNLVGYWALNEDGGANNALDAHSNALTLTQVASPGANTGIVYNTARTFDGTTQYVQRASEAILQSGNVDFTFAAWIRCNAFDGSEQWIGSKGTSEWYLHLATDNRLRFVIRNAEVVFASTFGALSTATWYLCTGWHDAANGRIGASVNATANTAARVTAPGTNTDPFRIAWGSPLAVRSFNGRVGPAMMWKSAAGGGGVLTAAQRTALYNNGNGLAYSQFTT